jgi:hypothetical protein
VWVEENKIRYVKTTMSPNTNTTTTTTTTTEPIINFLTQTVCPFPYIPPPPLKPQQATNSSQCTWTYAQGYGTSYIQAKAVTVTFFTLILMYQIFRLTRTILEINLEHKSPSSTSSSTKPSLSCLAQIKVGIYKDRYNTLVAIAAICFLLSSIDLFGYENVITPCGNSILLGLGLYLLFLIWVLKSDELLRMIRVGQNLPSIMSEWQVALIGSSLALIGCVGSSIYGWCLTQQYRKESIYFQIVCVTISVIAATIPLVSTAYRMEKFMIDHNARSSKGMTGTPGGSNPATTNNGSYYHHIFHHSSSPATTSITRKQQQQQHTSNNILTSTSNISNSHNSSNMSDVSSQEQRRMKTMNLIWAKVITALIVALIWIVYVLYIFLRPNSDGSDPFVDNELSLWFLSVCEMIALTLLAISHRRNRNQAEISIWFRTLATFVDICRRKLQSSATSTTSSTVSHNDQGHGVVVVNISTPGQDNQVQLEDEGSIVAIPGGGGGDDDDGRSKQSKTKKHYDDDITMTS